MIALASRMRMGGRQDAGALSREMAQLERRYTDLRAEVPVP